MEIDTKREFDLESEDFNLDQIVDTAVDWVSSQSASNPKTEILILPSTESTPFLELKALPEHLKYAYLGGRKTLQVIITCRLTEKTRGKFDVNFKETQRSHWMDNEWYLEDKSSDSIIQNSFERWCDF